MFTFCCESHDERYQSLEELVFGFCFSAACCEEVFRGAFDIGLLILFARRVGLPVDQEQFVTKFSEELHIIKASSS